MNFKIKSAGLLLAAVLFVSVLSGCGKTTESDGTVFELNKDGSVTQTIVAGNDDSIAEAELEKYIAQQIADYTAGSEEPAVDLKSCNVEAERITVEIEYASIEDYAGFNNVPAFNGDIRTAFKDGFLFAPRFTTAGGMEYSGYTLPVEYPGMNVLILQEPMNVIVPDKVVLISDNIKKNENGSYTIGSSEVSGIPDIFQTINMEPSYIVYKPSSK